MAKKKSFGKKEVKDTSDRRMAKVIVATKTTNGKYGYKEAIINEDNVQDFIAEHKED